MTRAPVLFRFIAVSCFAAILVVAGLDAAAGWPLGPIRLLYGAIAGVFVSVGWLLAERRPRNVVGFALLLFGAAFAWYLPADLYLMQPGRPTGAEFAALFITALDAPMFIILALILILFPDGALPSPRWRVTLRAGALGIALAVVGYALDGGPMRLYPAYSSPFGIPGFAGVELVLAAYVIMMGLLVLAAVALGVRWRRGDPTLRAQIKWLVAATLVLLITEVVNVLTFRPDAPYAITTTVASIAIALVPIAIGVAVLRYRLYAIDRLVSRGIAYGLVTAILGITFVGIVLTLQGLLAPFTQQETIAVAASTLAVFALFQPLRRRVQATVDRRFDRTRHDGERLLATLGERLRDEIDLTTISLEARATVDIAVRPTRVGLWLRGGSR